MNKTCSICNLELPLEDFSKIKKNKDGLSGSCKICVSVTRKLYRKNNKEKINNYNNEFRKEYISNYNKEYRIKNIVKLKLNDKLFKQNHKEAYNAYAQKHRNQKRLLESSLTIKQWDSMKEDFNHKCAYCGKKSNLTYEHFIPLNLGGEYSINNIIPVCSTCNCSKGAKDFFIWYKDYKYYNKGRETKILKYLHYNNGIQQLALTV